MSRVTALLQLTAEEFANLRSQIGISSSSGGSRYAPYPFTEHGVAMLSSVLRSHRAVRVNIEIMRGHKEIAERGVTQLVITTGRRAQ